MESRISFFQSLRLHKGLIDVVLRLSIMELIGNW